MPRAFSTRLADFKVISAVRFSNPFVAKRWAYILQQKCPKMLIERLPARYTTVQLLIILYTNPERHCATMHNVTDAQTDGQTTL